MKSQDIVIIMKIISMKQLDWRLIDIAYQTRISLSEVSEGMKRLRESSLLFGENKVNTENLREFLFHGLKYCFPAKVERTCRGILTAHSSRFMKNFVESESISDYVWPYEHGESYGLSVRPLYKTVPGFVEKDDSMYEALSYIDVLRLGRVREIALAKEKLTEIIKKYDAV
ncbi:MAG: hypothetical protein AB7T10_09220 [bacterium]